MKFEPFIGNGATFSPDMKMRFLLWRTWDASKPRLGWIMLNPSSAGASDDDPTIRKCVGFGERNGFGGLAVVNLSPWIETNSIEFLRRMEHEGEESYYAPIANGRAFQRVAENCDSVVCAWGAHGARLRERAVVAVAFFRDRGVELRFLGRSKNGEVRHPLMLGYDTVLERG